MESVSSSPHRMKATKKENSTEGGNGNACDDMISLSNSTCGSVTTDAPKVNNNKKILRNVWSIRRRVKSRIIHPSVEMSYDIASSSSVDESDSSPHYLKATSSSKGKKSSLQANSSHSSPSHGSLQTLSRSSTSGNRTMGILLRKTSFKPKRPLMNFARVSKDIAVDRATHSSILKDSKLFPKPVELLPDSEMKLAVKVCRYHHCSLHGHCHGNNDSVSTPKRFKRRSLLKKQMSMIPKHKNIQKNDKKKNIQKNEMIQIEEPVVVQERDKDEVAGDEYRDLDESYLVEMAFGETAYPERSYQETLSILRKNSPLVVPDSGATASGLISGYCLNCSCKIQQQITAPPDMPLLQETVSGIGNYNLEVPQNEDSHKRDTRTFPVFEKPKEQVRTLVEDDSETIHRDGEENEGFEKDLPETPVIFDKVTKNNAMFSESRTSSGSNSEGDDGNFTTNESNSDGNSRASHVEFQDKDSEIIVQSQAITGGGGKLQFSKQRHVSMWHLIHQRMSSDLAAQSAVHDEGENAAKESSRASDMGTLENNDDSDDVKELEIRKLFAIKLVREAIEKILLPEVQDITSESTTPRPELIEKSHIDVSIQDDHGNKEDSKVKSNPKEESLIKTDDVASDQDLMKSGKTGSSVFQKKAAPKHWSNLKKWILLQRFIKELEKVRKFNFRKPNHLPLNPDPEGEKVELRAQTVDERKKSEEWMLDYALRQAVSQLAPTQKRKVALLVKAFETVVPSPDQESQIQVKSTTPRPKDINTPHIYDGNNKEVPFDFASIGHSVKQESGTKLTETPQISSERRHGEMNMVVSSTEENKASNAVSSEGQNHIKMWHMIYQHVVSGIAEKIGSKILDASDDEQVEENNEPGNENHLSNEFTKTDALKLIKEAVDEILLPEIPEENIKSRGVESPMKHIFEPQKSKNWSKLKKLILLKRSIGALQMARRVKPQCGSVSSERPEPEKIELRKQMMDERNKAEQWMLDYAVQHIVGKLTPARKRRVSMLVEAFEAVVPLPVPEM